MKSLLSSYKRAKLNNELVRLKWKELECEIITPRRGSLAWRNENRTNN